MGFLRGCNTPSVVEVFSPSAMEEKRHLFRAYQNDPSFMTKKVSFTNVRNNVQSRLRYIQDYWLSAKADEIRGYAVRHKKCLRYTEKCLSSHRVHLLCSALTSQFCLQRRNLEDICNSVLNRPQWSTMKQWPTTNGNQSWAGHYPDTRKGQQQHTPTYCIMISLISPFPALTIMFNTPPPTTTTQHQKQK